MAPGEAPCARCGLAQQGQSEDAALGAQHCVRVMLMTWQSRRSRSITLFIHLRIPPGLHLPALTSSSNKA